MVLVVNNKLTKIKYTGKLLAISIAMAMQQYKVGHIT
jgi:hypothetical protein